MLSACIDSIKGRGSEEKAYWETERNSILAYSREQAVKELIKSKKVDEKIRQIDIFIRGISK